MRIGFLMVAIMVGAGIAMAQQTDDLSQWKDTSKIGPDGTAYVTRVVPVPKTISPEAQQSLAKVVSDMATTYTMEQTRGAAAAYENSTAEVAKKIYPVTVEDATVAGVPVRMVSPMKIEDSKKDKVLINLHGGGFTGDWGSLTETIPIANLTGIKVVAVLYRLAPEHPFPAAVDDSIAVYKELLKTYKPEHIGIYGTSAGAILTAEVTAKIKQLKMPMPAATGVFSGLGDFSKIGDSWAIFSLSGFSGHLEPPSQSTRDLKYVGTTDPKDPVLSPILGDLSGFPPTLFVTSGRDALSSGTTTLHRAYLRSGVDARLVEFEALGHAFWNNPELPESKEADGIMARFFVERLGR